MLSGYRLMWMVVMFDLPVVEKAERKAATAFRNDLLSMGFEMSQFSVYMRFCTSETQVQTYCGGFLAWWRQGQYPSVHRQAVRAHRELSREIETARQQNARSIRFVLAMTTIFLTSESKNPLMNQGVTADLV
jgi:CRISPR associated protein Cas2